MTTMATNSESISSIKFRTKFEKFVTDANRTILTSTFEKFCSYAPSTNYAREILWCLTYKVNPIESVLVKSLGLNSDIISLDNISRLRDELRYQYEKRHGSYLITKVQNYYAYEFNELLKHTDNIISDIVVIKCQENCKYNINPFRALYLLDSDQEKNYFGGLRELGFDSEEAQFLKVYHEEIRNLYKAMCEKYAPEDDDSTNLSTSITSSEEDDDSLPFFLNIDDSDKKTTPNSFKFLTSVEILNNRDVFASFVKDFNTLVDVGKLGFDLNEVIAKKEAIIQLLNADKALSK